MARGGGRTGAARRTVLVALAANASIAVAKLVAGLVSGSSAMLAEAAHSVADTMNQVFLLFSLALGEREPDAEHPFGYGKERFFWSFLAAVGIFVAGAGFSLYEGLHRIFGPPDRAAAPTRSSTPSSASRLPGRGRLARARVAPDAREASREATVARALRPRQPRPDDQDRPLRGLGGRHRRRRGLRRRRAAPGHRQPGLRRPGVGGRSRVLLATVAVALGRDTKGAAHRRGGDARGARGDHRDHRGPSRRRPRARAADDGALAPDRLLVAARIDLADGLSADEIERASSELDRELHERIPTVWQVFLDATLRAARWRRREEDRQRATGA